MTDDKMVDAFVVIRCPNRKTAGAVRRLVIESGLDASHNLVVNDRPLRWRGQEGWALASSAYHTLMALRPGD